MTQNSLRYHELLEVIRHNKLTEEQAAQVLAESRRHNVAVENETNRSNLANEAIHQEGNRIAAINAEINRTNAITNAFNAQAEWFKIQEGQRHNLASEYEINRNNLVIEGIQSMNATSNRISSLAAMKSANVNLQKVILERSQFHENRRHNQTMEIETNRHNVAVESNEARKINNNFIIDTRNVQIAQQNANTNRFSAQTNAMLAQTQAALNQARVVESQTKSKLNNAQTTKTNVETVKTVISGITSAAKTAAKTASSIRNAGRNNKKVALSR